MHRPSDGFLKGDEFDKRMAACTAECKKKGPAARTQAIADKARGAREAGEQARQAATERQLPACGSSNMACVQKQMDACCMEERADVNCNDNFGANEFSIRKCTAISHKRCGCK